MESVLEKPVVPPAGGGTGHKLPELLAPAGDWECARAAVENGADAIYFGLDKFNARMRAHNFTEPDLPRLLEYLHSRGVKGYLTFNTLVFQDELDEAEKYLRSMIAAGVDAAIVQDAGMCRMIRGLSPDFPIHVSTQMTITSANGVEFARELGCNLVVLARECTLKDLASIQAAQQALFEGTGQVPLPLEVFVHGALCVAYSGQCLTSESLGGRSANRGECAQACRMPYALIADGQEVPLGNRRYLLSPQDLAGLELLPELARLGIASLKIEGRLKSPEYVANITRIYRQALDGIEASGQQVPAPPSESDSYEMQMAFSRGLFSGWFKGINNQELVHANFGTKRGVYLGEVLEVRRDSVVLDAVGPLKPGDGVVFDAGTPDRKEEGGRVYEVQPQNSGSGAGHGERKQKLTVAFGRGDIDFKKVRPGNKLWKTSDPVLEKRLRRSFEGDTPRFQRPITVEAHGSPGSALTLLFRDSEGHVARADSQSVLQPAENQPLTAELLAQQLGRLGGTPFKLDRVESKLQGSVSASLGELNRMRRDAVAELLRQRCRAPRWTLGEQPLDRPGAAHSARVEAARPELIVLVRNLDQLRTALDEGIRTVYCEFEDPKKYRDAIGQFRIVYPVSQPRPENASIWVAPPRIFKMGEEWTLKQTRSSQADGYLVRNYDHLIYFAGERRIGDYSLNVSNTYSAHYFLERFGLERLTASYDLNIGQLHALLSASRPGWFEVTLHQHMPMFHMEHCVFCAFLTKGTDYTNCGRPCDRVDLKLKDRVGAEHPVKADAGCRNTVFNALAQTGAEYAGVMRALGVSQFRIEFLNEPPSAVSRTVGRYRDLLAGRISGQELWRELKLMNQLGVTRGQLASQRK